ncbi:hypothetical protein GE09DRAFT_235631 [Coniochaeta sp. 2T2.1]|nr:hypothetical protein GE09DRAFT_235631 [Coniochaeta sp. 2T2.1]
METLTVTTPTHSTTPEIHTPGTPKHGYSDNWEPYSPRKSNRISQRSQHNNNNHAGISIHRTPSPRGASSRPRQADRVTSHLGSPRATRNHLSTNSSSATPTASMTSPTSPQKKRQSAMDSARRASGSLTLESTATAAAVLGFGGKTTESRTGRASMAAAAGLLPTPAKTPQKTPSPKTKANINAVRRNLFHQDEADVVPTPKRTRGKKHVLDSFAINEDDDESFPIFTDSRERIPEVDPNEDNPFYGPSITTATSAAPRRRSRRQHVNVPGEGKITVEEAVKREDGMLIVFRGKKQFRKFADMEEATGSSELLDSGDGGLDAAVQPRLRRPMTRSTIKPRLLFPVAEPAQQEEPAPTNLEDEEAETDIEEPVSTKDEMDLEEDEPQTPNDLIEQTPDTPLAPKFAPTMPASPPTTQRTTRHGTKSADETTPMKPTRGGKRSPFDGWRRTKNGGSESSGSKRSGEALTADAAKRSRA